MKPGNTRVLPINKIIINGWPNWTGISIVYINYHSRIMGLMQQRKNLHTPVLLAAEGQIIQRCNSGIPVMRSRINSTLLAPN